MRRIEKVKKVCNVLNGFVASHKAILDDKARADLHALEERVDGVAASLDKCDDDIVIARNNRNDSFVNLQRSIIGCKKAVEWVVVRDGRNVEVPRISVIINNPGRIHILAEKFLKAAKQAGNDPMLVKAATALSASLDAYTGNYGDAYDKVTLSRSSKETFEGEIQSLGGQVNGYKTLILYRAQGKDRTELLGLLKAAFPHDKSKKGGKEKTETLTTGAAMQPTALPALPTIPGVTTVPQTGDHPQLSANA